MPERRSEGIDFLSVVSAGFFFLLIGGIFVATPHLSNKIDNFAHDFHKTEMWPGVSSYAPTSNHPEFYNALFQFCLIFAIFQVVILATRFILKESVRRKSRTFSSLFFWFGAATALNLLKAGSIDWFIFLGWLIVFIGMVITVRSVISFVFWKKR